MTEQVITPAVIQPVPAAPVPTPPLVAPPVVDTPPAFPADTPVSEMKPEEQTAYWREAARKHESRNKEWQKVSGGKTSEEIAAELESLRDRNRTDSEKAIAQAKKDARAEVEAEYAPRLVTAAFSAALSTMKPEDRVELLDTINPAKFLTEKGDLDTDKVSKWIAKYGPQSGTDSGTHVADHGAGRRTSQGVSPSDQGLAEAIRRFGPKTKAAQ